MHLNLSYLKTESQEILCRRNAKDYILYSQERLLTLFPGRAERRKRKQTQKEEKAIPAGTSRQNDVELTSVRRPHVASTFVRRYLDVARRL